MVVPVLIHLFGRRRPRLVRFPSLMLLEAAPLRRRSPLRVRRLLSLLMRAGAVALLALALARPVARWGGLAWLSPTGPVHAVVLDCSASMDAGGNFHRARDAAREVLQALAPGSRVLMVLGRADLAQIAEARPVSRETALEALDAVSVLAERTRAADVIGAVATRMEQLGSPGNLFFITDLQRSSYEEVTRPASSVQVVIVAVKGGVSGNRAISEVRPAEPVALKGRPVQARLRVDVWGQVPAGRVPVTVKLGGYSSAVGVNAAAEGSSWADVTLFPPSTGVHAGAMSLPCDRFPADDSRWIALHVRQSLRVLIVGDEQRSRYLRAALDPFGDERAVVRVQVVAAQALGAADLGGQDVVVLADPSPLAEGELEALVSEVQRGLGLLVFAGPRALPAWYAQILLPAVGLGDVRLGKDQRVEDGYALVIDERSAGPLTVFADPTAGDLSTARFAAFRQVALASAGATTVWARYADGTPAVLGTGLGRGRVGLLNMAPDDSWSDLVRQAAFVPLVHRLVYYLAGGRQLAVQEAPVGEATVGLAPEDAGRLALRRFGSAGEEPLEVETGRWRQIATEPGVYRLLSGEEELGGFAANLDPAESNLTALAATEVRRYLRPLQVTVVPATAAQRVRAYTTAPADVSRLIALLALLLLAAEAVYSLEEAQPVEE